MSDDSKKEKLRKMRREAYRRAKEMRESDPKFQEMKAKQKEKQREIRKAAYQRAKTAMNSKKEARSLEGQEKRDAELMALMKPASEIAKNLLDEPQKKV